MVVSTQDADQGAPNRYAIFKDNRGGASPSRPKIKARQNKNIILKDNHGGTSSSRPTTMCTVNGGRIIANQLQFVCTQLRCETKALEIPKNTIKFSALDAKTTLSSTASLPPYLVDCPHRLVFRVKENK
jgi:hypothetical protein